MHQTRQETITQLPIQRKGSKYVARAKSNVKNSVPLVIAVRDMLRLAKTAKEVREMIKQKLLKINGRIVEDYGESIQLFNVLEAGKVYRLSILPTQKFFLEESKEKSIRLCKIVGKTLLRNNTVQLNLHDGTNIVTKDSKLKVSDSLYLDFETKVKKHVSFEKGADIFVFKGKYAGIYGKLKNTTGKHVTVELDNKITAGLDESQVIAQ